MPGNNCKHTPEFIFQDEGEENEDRCEFNGMDQKTEIMPGH